MPRSFRATFLALLLALVGMGGCAKFNSDPDFLIHIKENAEKFDRIHEQVVLLATQAFDAVDASQLDEATRLLDEADALHLGIVRMDGSSYPPPPITEYVRAHIHMEKEDYASAMAATQRALDHPLRRYDDVPLLMQLQEEARQALAAQNPPAAPQPALAAPAKPAAPPVAVAVTSRATGGKLLPGTYVSKRVQPYPDLYPSVTRWRTLLIRANGTAELTWHQQGTPASSGCAQLLEVFEMRYALTPDGSYDMSYDTRASHECGTLRRKRDISWPPEPLTVTEDGVMIRHRGDGVFHYTKQ